MIKSGELSWNEFLFAESVASSDLEGEKRTPTIFAFEEALEISQNLNSLYSGYMPGSSNHLESRVCDERMGSDILKQCVDTEAQFIKKWLRFCDKRLPMGEGASVFYRVEESEDSNSVLNSGALLEKLRSSLTLRVKVEDASSGPPTKRLKQSEFEVTATVEEIKQSHTKGSKSIGSFFGFSQGTSSQSNFSRSGIASFGRKLSKSHSKRSDSISIKSKTADGGAQIPMTMGGAVAFSEALNIGFKKYVPVEFSNFGSFSGDRVSDRNIKEFIKCQGDFVERWIKAKSEYFKSLRKGVNLSEEESNLKNAIEKLDSYKDQKKKGNSKDCDELFDVYSEVVSVATSLFYPNITLCKSTAELKKRARKSSCSIENIDSLEDVLMEEEESDNDSYIYGTTTSEDIDNGSDRSTSSPPQEVSTNSSVLEALYDKGKVKAQGV